MEGRRVRLPVHLLLSPHHSDSDLLVWAWIDLLGRRDRENERRGDANTRYGDVLAGRKWLAWRLGMSVDGVSKCLTRLYHEHTGEGLVPDASAYVEVVRRRCRKTAARRAIPGVPPVHVPEASLGDVTDPAMPVSAAEWRLFALLLHLRHETWQTVALPAAELAQLLHKKPATIAKLVRGLVAAGLVVAVARTGLRPIIAPLLALTDVGRADAVARLVRATSLDLVDKGVDNGLWIVSKIDGSSAPAYPSPDPMKADHLSPSGPVAIESLAIGDPGYKTLGGAARATPPGHTPPPGDEVTSPSAVVDLDSRRTSSDVVGQSRTPSDARSEAELVAVRERKEWDAAQLAEQAERELVAARERWRVQVNAAGPWCQRCDHPRTRIALDLVTALPTGKPCPTCAPDRRAIAS